jgi:hypothetical protein
MDLLGVRLNTSPNGHLSVIDGRRKEIEKQTLQAQNQARATAARGGGWFPRWAL